MTVEPTVDRSRDTSAVCICYDRCMSSIEIPLGTAQQEELHIECRKIGDDDEAWVDWSGNRTKLSSDPGVREAALERARGRVAEMNEKERLLGWEFRIATRMVWMTEWMGVR